MTLDEIIAIADAAYPDGFVARYWNAKRQAVRRANLGDTLAQFIVRELKDTFDPQATDAEQIATAAKAIENAASELAAVAAAFRVGTR